MVWGRLFALGLTLCLAYAVQQTAGADSKSNANDPPALRDVHRIVFLGDSITYSGEYVDYLDALLRTQFPGRRFDLIDIGLPSETVSGLSEPNHAGGAFPRPDLHERMQRALDKTHPDLVVACYGMNDGIYFPFSEARFEKYQAGIHDLVQAVHAHHARLLLLTPPVFDSQPILDHTFIDPKEPYPVDRPYAGYDTTLGRYGRRLLDQQKEGWTVADVHGPMRRHLDARRAEDPDYRLAGDGVHANAFGHWLMAQAVLRAWGVAPGYQIIKIDFHSRRAIRGRVTDLKPAENSLEWNLSLAQPIPFDPQWDVRSAAMERAAEGLRHPLLIIRNVPAGRWRLLEDETPVADLTDAQLAEGVDLASLPELSTTRKGLELLNHIHTRGRLQADAWLTDIGHRRPGMAKGLPLEEAKVRAAAQDEEIAPLAAPVTLRLRLSRMPE